MRIAVLHNHDSSVIADDPGKEAREDVVQVAAAMVQALSSRDHQVLSIPVSDDFGSLQRALKAHDAEMVVNLCESLAADSRGEMLVPALLDVLRLPYTGSSAMSLGLALHKEKAKDILRGRGVPTPAFHLIERAEQLGDVDVSVPLIVKPAREDASVGIDFDSVVNDHASLKRSVTRVFEQFKQPAIVEHFVDGREIYVPILGNQSPRPLPLTEIRFTGMFETKPKILTYRAKWHVDSTECIDSPSTTAALTPAETARCLDVAHRAFAALDCRDYGRIDLRLAADGTPWVIDINPNCDLHPKAGFAMAALTSGLSYADLASHLVALAAERHHGNQTHRPAGQSATRRTAAQDRDLHPRRSHVRT